MKRIIALMALVLMFGVAGNASALPILNTSGDAFEDFDDGTVFGYYENTGEFMDSGLPGGVYPGNNDGQTYNTGTLEVQVEVWLNTNGYIVDPVTFVLTDTTENIIFKAWYGNALVSCNPEDPVAANSGTWEVVPTNGVISFYAVKASDAYAMYFVNPADSSGSWSTYDLWDAGHPGDDLEISHFTGYNMSPAPVPEPCTMLLFGTGLIGMAASRFKKKK